MRRSLWGALVVVSLAGPTSQALADHPRNLDSLLKGKFRFTLNQTCTYTTAGFATDVQNDILGSGQSGGDYIQGTIRFDGKGGMTSVEKGIYQNHGASYPGFFPVLTYTDLCTGNYDVNADLSFTYEVACRTNFLTGPNAPGGYVTVSGIKYEGQIDESGNSLIATSTSNAVQTQTFSSGFTQQRICGGQISGIRIP